MSMSSVNWDENPTPVVSQLRSFHNIIYLIMLSFLCSIFRENYDFGTSYTLAFS